MSLWSHLCLWRILVPDSWSRCLDSAARVVFFFTVSAARLHSFSSELWWRCEEAQQGVGVLISRKRSTVCSPLLEQAGSENSQTVFWQQPHQTVGYEVVSQEQEYEVVLNVKINGLQNYFKTFLSLGEFSLCRNLQNVFNTRSWPVSLSGLWTEVKFFGNVFEVLW